MIQPINFKANYIDTTTVKKLVTKNQYKNCNVSFVQLNPLSIYDWNTVSSLNDSWEYGLSYAERIKAYMDYVLLQRGFSEYIKFFALTRQKKDFEILEPAKVLGLVQIEDKPEDLHISFLQVNPEYNTSNANRRNPLAMNPREYKNVGTAIINSIKKLYSGKDIHLCTNESAKKFYLKNGFKFISERSMIFKAK